MACNVAVAEEALGGFRSARKGADMAWSTSRLAALAGTSLRTVRHYHERGLLAEPVRQPNGYKNYGVAHLRRVMRIRRLSGLGLSLAQIAEMGDAEEYPEQVLRALNAELADTIARLDRVCMELALVMRKVAPTDLPPEMALAAADADLTEADHSLFVVLTRLITPKAQKACVEVLKAYGTDLRDKAFDDLSADAGEQSRHELAERMTPLARDVLAAYPELRDPEAVAPGGVRKTEQTLGEALEDLYNPAQRDVLSRIRRALAADPVADGNR